MYEQHSEEINIPTQITGSEQINVILYLPSIAYHITQSRITPFMEMGLFDHRGLFLDINITKFLGNTFIDQKISVTVRLGHHHLPT